MSNWRKYIEHAESKLFSFKYNNKKKRCFYVLHINFLIFITFRITTHTRENRRLDESIRRYKQHKF